MTDPLEKLPTVDSRTPEIPWWKTKSFMTLAACGMIAIAWAAAVSHIYHLPPEKLTTFQAITLYCLSGFVMILCWGIGMNNIDKIFSMKTEALSMASSVAQTLMDKHESKETIERIEHVYIEGSEGSPLRRPFNPDDSHETPA